MSPEYVIDCVLLILMLDRYVPQIRHINSSERVAKESHKTPEIYKSLQSLVMFGPRTDSRIRLEWNPSSPR